MQRRETKERSRGGREGEREREGEGDCKGDEEDALEQLPPFYTSLKLSVLVGTSCVTAMLYVWCMLLWM